MKTIKGRQTCIMEFRQFQNLQSPYKQPIYDLIQAHLKDIPPYLVPSNDEIATILQNPLHLVDLHLESVEFRQAIFVGVENEVPVAAAQLLFPVQDRTAWLPWIVGKSSAGDELQLFVEQLKNAAAHEGYDVIETVKQPFGVGWEGIGDVWPHLLHTITAGGFTAIEKWQSFWAEGISEVALPGDISYKSRYSDKEREYDLYLYDGKNQIGEIAIWLPGTRSVSLVEAGIADIEYIEIEEAFRGKRLGQAILSIAQTELRKYGIHRFMLWTEPDNDAMQKLAIRSGFQQDPLFHWMRADLT